MLFLGLNPSSAFLPVRDPLPCPHCCDRLKENQVEIREQIEALKGMTVGELREKYREVFGEE